ncbi:hypothetical protein V8F63_04940 [Brevundimonas sp. LF-1]|uniref:hypothetical protein n=1 Tax=Brevundimonas sp. LF-1 TaxID=3126100 RepID=UPI0030DE80D2
MIDARRGQVYGRLFRDGAPLGEAEAWPLETARDRILAEAGQGASCWSAAGRRFWPRPSLTWWAPGLSLWPRRARRRWRV